MKCYCTFEHHFWPIAEALTTFDFETRMQQLCIENPSATEYLMSIDRQMWVTAFYTGAFFGHKTSNVVESANKSLKSERELSILNLLHEIWNKTMAERYQRYTDACRMSVHQTHTDFCLQKLLQSQQWASRNRALMSSQTKGVVTQINGRTYEVDLVARVCECGHFQKNGIPCGHAFSCIFAIGRRPREYVPEYFTMEAWKNTYLLNLAPISLDNLQVEEGCNPPV